MYVDTHARARARHATHPSVGARIQLYVSHDKIYSYIYNVDKYAQV